MLAPLQADLGMTIGLRDEGCRPYMASAPRSPIARISGSTAWDSLSVEARTTCQTRERLRLLSWSWTHERWAS